MLGIRWQVWGLISLVAAAAMAAVALHSRPEDGRSVASARTTDPAPTEQVASDSVSAAAGRPANQPSGTDLAGGRDAAPTATAPASERRRAAERGRTVREGSEDSAPVGSRPERRDAGETNDEERAIEYARELGLELPVEFREAADALEPRPGEDEDVFAERLEDLEGEGLLEELLVEALLTKQYEGTRYRYGEPVSRHRNEIQARVQGMTDARRASLVRWVLRRAERRPIGPPVLRYYPTSMVPAYNGPDAEYPSP